MVNFDSVNFTQVDDEFQSSTVHDSTGALLIQMVIIVFSFMWDCQPHAFLSIIIFFTQASSKIVLKIPLLVNFEIESCVEIETN